MCDETYLALEKLSLAGHLRFQFDCEAESFLLPALSVQPLVENAVKHGISKRPGGGCVTVRTRYSGEAYIVTVEDDGVGFDPDAPKQDGRLHIGIEFEVFVDGKPLEFKHDKTKELLAYLVDRQTMCGNAEIIAALWEGAVSSSYFRTLRLDLKASFARAGVGSVLIQQWAKIGIDAGQVTCDYYDWQAGIPSAINAYLGEYMSQYSWAEFTNARLDRSV